MSVESILLRDGGGEGFCGGVTKSLYYENKETKDTVLRFP